MYGNTLIYVTQQLPVSIQNERLNLLKSENLNFSSSFNYAFSQFGFASSAFLSRYTKPIAFSKLKIQIKNPIISAAPNPSLS